MDSIVSSSQESSSTPRQPSRKPITWSSCVVDRLAHDRADHRVQPGAVSASGQALRIRIIGSDSLMHRAGQLGTARAVVAFARGCRED